MSGTIYVFGAVVQTVPAWGIQINDSTGKCILTNETRVLRGINIVSPTGNAGTADYLNETVAGKKAIIPAQCGAVVYSQYNLFFLGIILNKCSWLCFTLYLALPNKALLMTGMKCRHTRALHSLEQIGRFITSLFRLALSGTVI
ncbi:hypothetical protein EB241_14060 [Erwinia psidii]|uniref:Uncharacterized protein n=1 Tax=Erwinia psidii TaxID=69224 RepID=A0A3N6RX34_9GAMM|nr:hypothetical protein EB241_14060 [Erwinia psidii]